MARPNNFPPSNELSSRDLNLSSAVPSPPTASALHAGFMGSDSAAFFNRTTVFRATMIVVGLLLILLICIARWDSILDCFFSCGRPPSPADQPVMIATEMKKAWSRVRSAVDAVPILRYSARQTTDCSQDPSKASTAECVFCLNDFKDGDLIRVLPNCGHLFHVKCSDPWFLGHISCPICRMSISQNAQPSIKCCNQPSLQLIPAAS